MDEWILNWVDGWNNGSIYTDIRAEKIYMTIYSYFPNGGFTWIEGSLSGTSTDGTPFRCPIARISNSELYQALCDSNVTIDHGWLSYSIKVQILIPGVAMHFDVWLESDDPQLVTVSTWTNDLSARSAEEPLIIYARLTQNRRPVSNVSVVAVLSGNSPKESNETQIILSETTFAGEFIVKNATKKHIDSRFFKIDVTEGDGIYSGAALSLPSDSSVFTYRLKVLNQTGTIDSGKYDRHPSAGSKIPMTQPTSLSSQFNRYSHGQSIRPKSYQNMSKPGRVTDLQILSYANSVARLTWTAPRDQYGSGSSIGITSLPFKM